MSTTERPVSTALKTMLVNNEPFQYAHLIKFERPSRPDEFGQVSTSKQRYTYLTDASINVSFDDGSKDLLGTSNGTQTYLANKVLSVGPVQEQTRATPSNTTIVLDGNGLGADITIAAAIATAGTDLWDITLAAPIYLDDLLSEGFREGDKITITSASNSGITVNIHSFRGTNVLRVSKIDTELTTQTSISTRLKLASEEIISILLNKNAADYASFINREVFIYRGYFQNGVVVGSPTCIFKGIISGVSFEDSEGSIKVSWNLSSHWADFAQVKGRITSDSAHRALDANGAPQPTSALKSIYAYDKGFIHGETSVNMLTKYVVQVEKQDIKSKKGFLGIGAGVKVKKYSVPEDRFTNLDFQIQAKAIPVIYGVRKPEAMIPVFADTLDTNSSEVYVVAVICEGEIGGIYDVIIEGNSLLCNDKADFDARSAQTAEQTVQLVCRGRADRGDALGGEKLLGSAYPFYIASGQNGEAISLADPSISNFVNQWYGLTYLGNIPISPPAPTGYGLVDGDSLRLAPPISQQQITLDIFTGKPGQKASAQLSQIAFNKGFKIQKAYWMGSNTYEYWGPNHRLLDTAYIVGKFIIKEGETTIPEINVVVRGKLIDCYNYDYSYLHDDKATSESANNFPLGSTVTLWTDTNTQINTLDTIQIIDKWTFYNPDGTENVRFRFNVVPELGYDSNAKPSIKRFYMKNGNNQTWTMLTFNYNRLGAEFSASTGKVNVGEAIVSRLSGTPNVAGTYVTFNYNTKPEMTYPASATKSYQVVHLNGSVYDNITGSNTFPYAIMEGSSTPTSSSLVTYYTSAAYGGEATALASTSVQTIDPLTGTLHLASKNTVKLPGSASTDSTAYVGDNIEITRYIASTGKVITQSAVVSAYDGPNQIAAIDGIWDFIPVSTDFVRIYPKYSDRRVSINPAIQTLDYITSPTYGKGLDYTNDLDLPSWLDTARRCDTRSDVTLLTTQVTGTPSVGDVYRYPATGNILWQGTVSSISGSYIKFTDIIGKLTNRWNSWKSWKQNEVIYNTEGSIFIVNTAGVYGTEPTTTSVPAGLTTNLSPFVLTRISGDSTLTPDTSSGNPIRALNAAGQTISGYSIYDCDDINYWRVSGWDEHAQRYVTRNQCNITIDTSIPLFDNINALLDHFNGILRYTAGKYYLDMEEMDSYESVASLPSSNNYIGRSVLLTSNNRRYRYNESNAWELDIKTITVDDIIGKIQLSDEGTRSAFNSLTASFADPANKFEPRNVSFFNSDYLKTDRNVPKKGNLSIPGITNYYNTRLLADSFLNKSRFGLTISMTVRPLGFLLLAGTVIQVIYPRYDWDAPGKSFRVESVTYQPDGLVDIVAKEYDDSFYTLTNIKRVAGTGATTAPAKVLYPETSGPTNLTCSQDKYNQILLTWENGPNVGFSTTYTEIWRSDTNNIGNATIIAVVPVYPGTTSANINEYVDTIPPTSDAQITKYYWVRHKVVQQ